MKKIGDFWTEYRGYIGMGCLALVILGWLLFYKLGSLTSGISSTEQKTALTIYGWHGMYHNPFYLPLDFIRSIVFKLFGRHGQTLTRLPNALFGGLTIICFSVLVWLWHGRRSAIFGTLLFASSAWVLHVSRLASNDVIYLMTVPVLLLISYGIHKHRNYPIILYLSILIWGILLYVPGNIWLIILNIIWLRNDITDGLNGLKTIPMKAGYFLLGLITLPLLIIHLRSITNLLTWLGFPQHLSLNYTFFKQFLAVPLHLTIRGPQYPQLWLGKAPLLDIFTLIAAILGIYFYVIHLNANRSRLLLSYFIIGWVLIALNGPVGLSLLVPIVYLCAVAGIAYLLREWLRVFPNNPLARSIGLGLIVFAVMLSCLYNLRAYFVAWPNNPTTAATFTIHRK